MSAQSQNLSNKDAASHINCAATSLRQSRVSGKLFGVKAPDFIKIGRTIRYRISTLDKWLDQFSEQQTTSKALTPKENLTDLELNKKNNITLIESRKAVHEADSALKQTITNHSLYQDKAGNSSSSPRGLVMQINKRVKSHFTHSVDDMTSEELILLVSLRNAIIKVINVGEANKSLRKEIKQKIYSTIEIYGQLIIDLKEIV